MRSLFLFMCLLLPAAVIYAQTPTQTVRGTIIDEDTRLPLPGANIRTQRLDSSTGTTTDEYGKFRLEDIPVGKIDLLVTHIGYQERIISDLEVNSAKEVILDIALVETALKLGTTEVTASDSKGDALNDLALVSARSISAEQTNRFAGGFNDPSKIASNFAGTATSQDGGNEIIIRGNSPKYIQWRLEGSQISNPNHFGDQNAVSGIVNALNNNLLSTSDFYTGAFPAEFGDALSGVYDIRMRKGNNEKLEGIFGLGVLGTDITLEGPFKKGYDGSFLVNYRYSTIGLVNDLGLIEVDGANLNFQDAAAKLWLPAGKWGTFSVFGLQGRSKFNFEDVDPGVWVPPGEDFAKMDIAEDYEKRAFLFNTGVNHTVSLSPKSYLKTSLVYSREKIDDKTYEHFTSDPGRHLNIASGLTKSTIRLSSMYNYKINSRHKLSVGIHQNWINQDMAQSRPGQNEERYYLADFDEGITSLQSYINWRFSPSNKITMVAGLHNTNIIYNQKHTLEPRFAINYHLTSSDKLSFGYGNHSRMESVHNYFAPVQLPDGTFARPNLDLGLLRSHHYVLGYEKYVGSDFRLKLETYYQDLYNIPVENDPNSSYSTLNEGLELNYVDLVNEGTGDNYGMELTLEKFLSDNFYVLFNASLFESKYTAADNIKRNTRYNNNYLVNLLAGKDFTGLGKRKNRIFSVNTKVFFGGGRYYVPLLRDETGNLAADPDRGLIYDESRAYQSKLDDIVNVVISVSHKWNLRRTTHEIYLNIDNTTNHRARLAAYFDSSRPDGIGYEKQVGVVPNLLYRVYF